MEGYKYHPLCKVCTARSPSGKSLREDIDAMITQGKKNVECIRLLAQYGVGVTSRNFSRHIHKHSPFTLTARQTNVVIKLKHELGQTQVDSREALQKIIDIGDQMIENWWNEVEAQPKMPVSEKMYIEAIKEEGRRAPRTRLSMEIDMMERLRIEGRASRELDDEGNPN